MKRTYINKLDDEKWMVVKKIILFGYGRQGKRLYKALKKDFEIIAIVENDVSKQGEVTEENVRVISFDEAVLLMKQYKTIVTTAEYHYKEIKEQLKKIGLKEFDDFIMYQQFVSEWYYKYKQKVYLLKTDIMVTPVCSLNCENCSQFIPYWKDKKSFDLKQLESDLDLYFEIVDFVMDMNIVGGEPFLYDELEEYIRYIGEKYRNRIGYLGIITNGTIVPKDNIIGVMKKYDVGISISDYSKEVDYKEKIDLLCQKLNDNKLNYIRNNNIQWFDFGFPNRPYKYNQENCAQHMTNCNTICHCLNDGKIYYCGTAWAAEKSGIFPKDSKSYVELDKIDINNLEDRKKVIECCLGNVEDGYIEFCKVCGGYGNDNDNRVVTGKQRRRDNEYKRVN